MFQIRTSDTKQSHNWLLAAQCLQTCYSMWRKKRQIKNSDWAADSAMKINAHYPNAGFSEASPDVPPEASIMRLTFVNFFIRNVFSSES